ncbi:DUF1328 domain-containing protein [Verrucomicrobiaceae bacterium R5-34]|uniref:DUF1328 domain-containing protein n=1 Tax=Oceaniferula flava TaxID=2800421 RepID=A0AAE2SCL0_9BACT|nr:DUF1328 family protein [Oceaniferula flavus]MBK1831214.1 DUF1328 domain-containing protein [Verrucomicrobiaceae bacterium R5-34]MBK1855383.1 DUF1328 domain-containing protein [Oceaniferula flavus]MBM1136689.1 DUF1328 domain-containing protein [Oceaniferula flavus]
MFHFAVTSLVFAYIAAVLGFGGLAGSAMGTAQISFFVFLALFLLSALGHVARGSR